MVNGIAFFSWNMKMGATLEVKYPLNLELTDDLINKIYMTHSYEEDLKKDELIEITYKDKIILSFCDKSKVADVGYEIFIIILDEKEKLDLYTIKSKLINFAKRTLQKSPEERKKYFLEKISTFIEDSSTKKILFIGRPGTGKSSIKKIVFEGYNPKELLNKPLEPTRGLLPSVYSWLDLHLGLFDSSGQELSDLLENENDNDHILAFEKTDIISYLFDYPTWASNSQQIIDDIQKVFNIINDKSYSVKVIIFIHKIDLIEEGSRWRILEEINKTIKTKFDVSIHYTSILPNFIYSLYNAFYNLLSSFSKESICLKEILDRKISGFSKTMFFITNPNDSIIVQSMSKDFDTVIINHSHNLVTQLNKTYENMSKNDKIDHLIISGSNINIIMNNLNYQKFSLKNLICLSETLSANRLIWLVGQIRLKLKNLYYLNKELG